MDEKESSGLLSGSKSNSDTKETKEITPLTIYETHETDEKDNHDAVVFMVGTMKSIIGKSVSTDM